MHVHKIVNQNHIHFITPTVEGWLDIFTRIARKIIKEIIENSSESRREWMLRLMRYYTKHNSNNSKYQLWKRDNHPVELVSDLWIGRKIHYTHQNPVRGGIVEQAEDYVYSSAKDYLENGREGLVKIECLETHL